MVVTDWTAYTPFLHLDIISWCNDIVWAYSGTFFLIFVIELFLIDSFILKLNVILGSFPRTLLCLTHVFILYCRLYCWTTLRPLVRYVLWGRCTAFLTHIYYEIISFWEFHLEISFWDLLFVLAGPLCGLRPADTWWAALRPSAYITWLAALRPFGPYILRFSFWEFVLLIFVLKII